MSGRRRRAARFATAGSVDDGKSHPDRPAALRHQVDLRGPARRGRARSAATRGDEYTNLALLTDGLRAEREQGITIDVAYRYFATPRRKFIIADTPGHIQYTRNMVTGASTADLALILVDARKGLVEQSRRHAFLVLAAAGAAPGAVRQQDGPRRLVARTSSRRSATSSRAFAAKLDVPDLTVIPVSALHGDNVVTRSREHAVVRRPVAAAPPGARAHRLATATWSTSASRCSTSSARSRATLPRLPRLRRPGRRRRAQAGRRGHGAAVRASPAGSRRSTPPTARSTRRYPPMSVTVRLDRRDRHLPRRPDLPAAQPAARSTQDIDAMVCWMDERRRCARARSTRSSTPRAACRALVKDLQYRLDVNTLHRDEASTELRAQRDRPGPAAHDAAAAGRRVPRATAPPAASSSSTKHQPHRRRRA